MCTGQHPDDDGQYDRPRTTGREDRAGENYGVKLISMAFLVPEEAPIVWRGPMVHQYLQAFFRDVLWGELDYLLIDLPPGTGDVQLSLSQMVPLAGAVTVTTPQEVALYDVRKGMAMFQKVNVPLLGIIENMSSFVCSHCGERTDIFSHGGGERAASETRRAVPRQYSHRSRHPRKEATADIPSWWRILHLLRRPPSRTSPRNSWSGWVERPREVPRIESLLKEN